MIADAIRSPDALLQDAKVYAALSGTFDAKAALPEDARSDEATIMTVASALAAACDTNPDVGEHWLLRTAERRYILETLHESGKLGEQIARRRDAGTDDAAEDLLRALEGAPPFSREEIARDLAKPPSQERIERIIVALDRAGPLAPAADLLTDARSTFAGLHRDERRKLLHDRGFFGRKEEIEKLRRWLGKGQVDPPVKAAFLSGLPGIGKSALLEEAIGIANDRCDSINVRLDFDRAGLNVLDVLGLTMEVVRQIAERLGEAGKPLLDARLAAASMIVGEESVAASRQSLLPRDLAAAIGAAVATSGRPVTLVLDTLEVLRGRGEQHPSLLFKWIDNLVFAGMRPVRVIAAGRGDALDSCPDRVGERVLVDSLDDEAVVELLERLAVPAASRNEIGRLAAGNPLVLRLGAEVVNRFGDAHLPRGGLGKQTASAFLYRFLLSRIDEPVLRRLAHPALIVRRISAALIAEVLGPELGLPALSDTEAERLIEALAKQHWLVARDPDDRQFLVHRHDMRPVLLPLLYEDQPALCARINAACVTWFGRREDAASQLDAAYHRLQLMRTRKDRPVIAASILRRFDPTLIAELPEEAQELVIRGKGGRSSQPPAGGGSGPGEIDDEQLSSELMNLLDRQDWAEGQYFVEQIDAAGGYDPRSRTADAIRAFWWGAGRWSKALRLLAERDRLGPDDKDLASLPWPLAIARIEMRAEFQRSRLTAALAHIAPERLFEELRASSRPLVQQGALAFWLAARDERVVEVLRSASKVSVLAAAFERWAKHDGRDYRQAVDSSRERLMSRGAPRDHLDEDLAAQLLAIHSPYVGFAANLLTQKGYEWLFDAAAEADQRLSQIGGLFGPAFGVPLAPSPSNPIAGIAGLGLFAEWIAALGFVRRDANLRAIGRAAERWRRTVAGSWRYGRPPQGWPASPRVDITIERRLRDLREQTDRHSAAHAHFGLWLPPGDAAHAVQQRLAATLESANREVDILDKAARLQGRNVPAAFIPPLTMLLDGQAIPAGDRT